MIEQGMTLVQRQDVLIRKHIKAGTTDSGNVGNGSAGGEKTSGSGGGRFGRRKIFCARRRSDFVGEPTSLAVVHGFMVCGADDEAICLGGKVGGNDGCARWRRALDMDEIMMGRIQSSRRDAEIYLACETGVETPA